MGVELGSVWDGLRGEIMGYVKKRVGKEWVSQQESIFLILDRPYKNIEIKMANGDDLSFTVANMVDGKDDVLEILLWEKNEDNWG